MNTVATGDITESAASGRDGFPRSLLHGARQQAISYRPGFAYLQRERVAETFSRVQSSALPTVA